MMAAGLLALALALALADMAPDQAAQVSALFDTAQVQACATADREAARACVDKVLQPDTKRRLLATPYQDIHQLGVPEGAPVVLRLNQVWPEGPKRELGAKLVAAGYVLEEDDPLFVVLQDYWLTQNGCDLDEQARLEDERRAQQYLHDAIVKAMKERRGVTVITPPHTFRPTCKAPAGSAP